MLYVTGNVTLVAATGPTILELQWFHLTHPPFGQSGSHSAEDSFRCNFVNEKFCILTKISLKFVPKGPIDNDPALV